MRGFDQTPLGHLQRIGKPPLVEIEPVQRNQHGCVAGRQRLRLEQMALGDCVVLVVEGGPMQMLLDLLRQIAAQAGARQPFGIHVRRNSGSRCHSPAPC